MNSLLVTMIWLPKKAMQYWGYQHISKIRTVISFGALHRHDHTTHCLPRAPHLERLCSRVRTFRALGTWRPCHMMQTLKTKGRGESCSDDGVVVSNGCRAAVQKMDPTPSSKSRLKKCATR